MTLRVLGILVGLAVTTPAYADIIVAPSDVSACRDKAAGAVCELRTGDGVCQPSTCSRRDYAKGPPGELVEEKCLRCAAVTATTPAPAAPPPPAPTAPAVVAPPAAPAAATPPPTAKGTGCQVGGGSLGLVLAGVLLVALARRTRRV
jgi:hypothetical protein